MIKLFNKIRSQLIGQGRMRKYLFYAIGEVLLVMVGILLALQFNNWNTEKENKKKEHWYLNNLVEDIHYQQEDLKDLKAHYIECINIGKSILMDYNKRYHFSDVDSLDSKLNTLMITDNFPYVNNTYEELVSSGQLGLIQNKDLSTDIIDYYLFTKDSEIDVKNNIENVFYMVIYPILNELVQIELEEEGLEENELSLLKNDEKIRQFVLKKLENHDVKLSLLNAIKTRILINQTHLELVDETLEIGNDLVKKIDAELLK
ncbi:DUF6090 family protein [Flavobacteriaceae bacterium S356]|uniref:DUF6090 family protein n=1 Tax=Asprobacillus argus TaxID=3076534 RepID=A0ABU3LEN4_9FLAO|nr:DUF6090 family protein [Flavobacteriaceae bacterium S356]